MPPIAADNEPDEFDGVPEFVTARLRASREQAGLSVRALAKIVDVSPSFISQIETAKANPSVGTLLAIVSALDITLDELFFAPGGEPGSSPPAAAASRPVVRAPAPHPPPRGPILRGSRRQTVKLAGGVRWERLTPYTDPSMTYLYATYEVGGESSPAGVFLQHRGREYGIVLSGRLGAQIGPTTYEVEAGDSIVTDCAIPHRFWTIGDEPAVVVWAIITGDH